MKLSDSTKNKIITAICYLYILLFVYASFSKLLDFENFQVQLAQSPLLSAYAGIISVVVITMELILAGMLAFEKTRLSGLYGSFSIMFSFTIYIFIILNFSDFIPCSCGGVLEKLGWTEHLIFNIAFIILAFVAIQIIEKSRALKQTIILSKVFVLMTISCGLVIILFLTSENIIKKENNFTRRFLPHAVTKEKIFDLKSNSYYFAGLDSGIIYLGNYSVPWLISSVDTAFNNVHSKQLKLSDSQTEFKSLRLKVEAPFYYLYDGTIPIIFRGKLSDIKPKKIELKNYFFNELKVIDSVNFIFRGRKTGNNHFVLGKLSLDNNEFRIDLNETLLKAQSNGVFDTDGTLLQDKITQNFSYIYYYRNEIIAFNPNLNQIQSLNTIDTTRTARITGEKLSDGRFKMGSVPVQVNGLSFSYDGILFNESKLMGKFESNKQWEKSTVIDIYSITNREYLGSFYLYNRGKEKMTQMYISDEHMYAIFGNEIVRYRFAQPVTRYFRKGEAENPLKE